MDTISMNSENSKTFKPHVLILKLTDKLDLIRSEKSIVLSNRIHDIWKNIKRSHKNNKFKIPALIWIDEFGLPDESYSISDIEDYFEYFSKTNNERIDNPSIRIYISKIENRNTFKIKTGYYLELLTPETMKLLGITENEITRDNNGENAHDLKITEVVLAQCNIVNNDYQQDSIVLYTFVPNKPFGTLLEISPTNHIILKTSKSECQSIRVWFTDQNSQQSEIKAGIN